MVSKKKCNLLLIFHSNTNYIPFTARGIILPFKNREGGAVLKSDKWGLHSSRLICLIAIHQNQTIILVVKSFSDCSRDTLQRLRWRRLKISPRSKCELKHTASASLSIWIRWNGSGARLLIRYGANPLYVLYGSFSGECWSFSNANQWLN